MKNHSSLSLNIGQRLMVVVSLLSLGLMALASYTFWQLENVKDTARHTESVLVRQLGQAAATELNVTRISLQLRHAILSRDANEMGGALGDIDDKRNLVEKAVKDYEALLFTPAGRSLFAQLPVALESFWSVAAQNVQLIREGRKAEAFAFLVDHTIPARNVVLSVLSKMVDYQRSLLSGEIDGIGKSVDATLKAILFLSLGMIFALLVASVHVARVLRRRVRFTGEVVERIRDGHLDQNIQDTTRDEFSPLVNALENMQQRLNQVVGSVRSGADFVDAASRSIANDNEELSQRTQVQAASLGATTGAAQQLADKIEHNFQNARGAVSLSNDAVNVAQRGGTVVSQVVRTMEDINASSRRIEEITGVIEGIAFQTNILALNAAVEAARAGVEGRGFAVVAAEVRSLAQRSSQAANEIKQLISASVERVAVGSELVAQAGATMREIVDSIQSVKDIVNNINSASEEQTQSLVDVNQSMRDMERTTEQNNGLVHKMNQSSSELRNMAQGLVSTVAYFKIGAEDAQAVPAPAGNALGAHAQTRRVSASVSSRQVSLLGAGS